MMDERVDQRAGPVARARMDHQPGGLVDDDQVLVLEEDIEGDFLALRLGRLRFGQDHRDALAGRHPALAFAERPAVQADRPRRISACTRLRDTSGPRRPASHWSSRRPAAAASTSATIGPRAPEPSLSIRRSVRYERSSKTIPE